MQGKSHSSHFIGAKPLIALTLARDLKRRKARDRRQLFVAEGVRTVEELLRSTLAIRAVLAAPQLAHTPRGAALLADLASRGTELAEVGEREFATAAETDAPQGVLAIAEIPQRSLDKLELASSARLLILDAVQDPGNVGALIRTAAALGTAATVALSGTVDLWNAKVVRSAMGAHFKHPALSGTWEELDAFRTRAGLALWGAEASGTPLDEDLIAPPGRLGLVVGNEGAGLTPASASRLERRLAIPMAPGIESLNVAVAAGILLYALRS